MQAILSDEIILILPRKVNAKTYCVPFEFQAVIRYVYARTSLPFSNSRQKTSSLFTLSQAVTCCIP